MDDPGSCDRGAWYFAYGSNLEPEKLRIRADLEILEEACAFVDGWGLCFDMPGIPPAEPSMANLFEESGSTVHGVVIKLSDEDFQALARSEGGGRFYRQLELEVTTYDDRRIRAFAFVGVSGVRLRSARPPSRRYLELIRSGARARGLDPDYCERLDQLPAAPASPLARRLSTLVLEVYTRAAKTRFGDPASHYLRLLQRSDELPLMPRAVVQAGLLAPVVVVGAVLRSFGRPRES